MGPNFVTAMESFYSAIVILAGAAPARLHNDPPTEAL